MTLVLSFGSDQSFNGGQKSNSNIMPCVFDNDSFQQEIESAFMRDWSTPISDYNMPAEEPTMKTPSGVLDLKRKPDDTIDLQEPHSKKTRHESTQENDSTCTSSATIQFLDLLEVTLNSATSATASTTSSEHVQTCPEEDDIFPPRRRGPQMWNNSRQTIASGHAQTCSTSEEEDDIFPPRRRGPQMWNNSRQRWKDERKRVLKMSVTKLAEIDDPELCLLRSVLVNNTVKRLHADIRNERQAKIRHRQQRIDGFHSHPLSDDPTYGEVVSSSNISKPKDLYDDSSCDELFGDDFGRRLVVDRRASSPIPTAQDSVVPMDVTTTTPDLAQEPMDVTTTAVVRTSCDTSSCEMLPERRPLTPNNLSLPSQAPKRQSDITSPAQGQQCATQYRNQTRDVTFPPRVPILDSVVYHSLLASLQSS